MIGPEEALAPVMLPVMVPIVQVKVLGVLAVKEIFGFIPLQVLAAAALVTAGFGFAVTVMVKAAPTQEPVMEVGVTMY